MAVTSVLPGERRPPGDLGDTLFLATLDSQLIRIVIQAVVRLSRIGVECHQGRIEIVSTALIRIPIRTWIAHAPVSQIELRIIGACQPHRGPAMLPNPRPSRSRGQALRDQALCRTASLLFRSPHRTNVTRNNASRSRPRRCSGARWSLFLRVARLRLSRRRSRVRAPSSTPIFSRAVHSIVRSTPRPSPFCIPQCKRKTHRNAATNRTSWEGKEDEWRRWSNKKPVPPVCWRNRLGRKGF